MLQEDLVSIDRDGLIAELRFAHKRIAELEAREAGRQLVEQELRTCKTWGNTILESFGVGVLLVIPETYRITYSNTHAAMLIGRPREDLIDDISHKYFASPKECGDPATTPEQRLDTYECALLSSTNQTIPIYKTVDTIILNGKKLLLKSFIDINAPQRGQKDLAFYKTRFEALYNLSLMVDEPEQDILDFALKSGLRATNSKIGHIYFVNKEESELIHQAWSNGVISQCTARFYPDTCKVSEAGLWGDAVRKRKPVITNNFQPSTLRREYTEGHINVKRHMIFPVEENGKIVLVAGVVNKEEEYTEKDIKQFSLIMHCAWNILERKRSVQGLRQALAEANQTRINNAAILNSVADGLIFTDRQNRITQMSASAEELLSQKLENVYLKPIEDIIESEKLAGSLNAIQHGDKNYDLVELDLFCEKERKTRNIQAKPAVVRDTDGTVSGLVTLLRDVSRERQLDRLKSEFIATAAHELRNPLTVLMGYSELLLKRQNFDEEQQAKLLTIIHKKAEVLGKIVDDFLNLARVDSGKIIRLKKDWADIGSIIRRCIIDHKRSCPDHNFEITVPQQSTIAFVDDRKLFQVMENLLGNAVKFSPPGSLIQVICETSEEDVSISISDEGIGMTVDQAGMLFEKFYRADASNTAKEGLGLGMAIVKSVIEAHGGQISVETELGKGTTVTFTLPKKKLETDLAS